MDTEIDYDRTAVSMADLFGNRHIVVPAKKTRMTERGELLKYFSERTGWPIPRISKRIFDSMGESNLQDLYFIKSRCDQDAGRRYTDREGKEQTLTWSQIFFGMLKPAV